MKLMKVLFMAFSVVALAPVMAFAQEAAGGNAAFSQLKPIGIALICVGSAMGIGKLASAAVESMARQPEVAGNISSSMIIAAALIEGFTFFALLLFLLGSASGY
jgi:F-type H+-transporting ATPase subunit c